VHSRQNGAGGRSGPETDSPWTHQQRIIACKKGTCQKGTTGKEGSKSPDTQGRRKSFTRKEKEGGVHRWLSPSHEQIVGREFTMKKKDSHQEKEREK